MLAAGVLASDQQVTPQIVVYRVPGAAPQRRQPQRRDLPPGRNRRPQLPRCRAAGAVGADGTQSWIQGPSRRRAGPVLPGTRWLLPPPGRCGPGQECVGPSTTEASVTV